MPTIARLLIITAMLSIGACASVPEEQRVEHDAWEPLNRTMYKLNSGLDKATLRPISKGYRAVMPSPVRRSISNFFRNLTTPRSIVNNFLQGKPKHGFSETGRFLLNSTIGIGGLFDVATAGGMEEYREDFGQTAARWGIPDGPYVMIPLLGPQTLRDAVFLPLDIVVDPLYQYDVSSVRDRLYGVRLIDLRYRLLSVEKLLDDSKDPYVTTRESYLQNREFQIYDGEPPEDDDFFDEFLEEDEDY